jgi:hypothetical protein
MLTFGGQAYLSYDWMAKADLKNLTNNFNVTTNSTTNSTLKSRLLLEVT